jgi:hypothetical protein
MMRRHAGEGGIALMMLVAIGGVLAVLAATSVMALANQQGATANDRSHKADLNYAEAALNSAVNASKRVPEVSQTAAFLDSSTMLADYNAAAAADTSYPTGSSVKTVVYDDWPTITWSPSTHLPDAPPYDQNKNGQVWLQVSVTFQGRTRILRALVVQTVRSVVTKFPKAALFSDGNISLSSGADVYMVNDDGTPYIPSPPGNYVNNIMAGGNVTGNGSSNLAESPSTTQSLGIRANGSVSSMPSGTTSVTGSSAGVPALSDYFNQADQANLMFEAQAGTPCQANASATSYSSKSSLLAAMSYNSGTKTYTASGDLKFSGDLTLNTTGTTYNFQSLYVTGDLTLNGSTTTNTTALYVGSNFTISGPTGLQQFGPIYCGDNASGNGIVTWTGPSSGTPLQAQTTDYTDSTAPPAPMYVGRLETSGLYNDVVGDVWCVGVPGTGTETVGLRANTTGTHSTFMCPLLGTTEKIVSAGLIDCGTVAAPMTLYMCCDNDNLYTNTMEWGSTGTFTGLMAVMEAAFTGTSSSGVPTVVGSVFCVKDLSISGNTSVCYNQSVIDHIQSNAITTTTTTTTVIPGTWQEVSAQ